MNPAIFYKPRPACTENCHPAFNQLACKTCFPELNQSDTDGSNPDESIYASNSELLAALVTNAFASIGLFCVTTFVCYVLLRWLA